MDRYSLRDTDIDTYDYRSEKQYVEYCLLVLKKMRKRPMTTREIHYAMGELWNKRFPLGDCLGSLIAWGEITVIHGYINKYLKEKRELKKVESKGYTIVPSKKAQGEIEPYWDQI